MLTCSKSCTVLDALLLPLLVRSSAAELRTSDKPSDANTCLLSSCKRLLLLR